MIYYTPYIDIYEYYLSSTPICNKVNILNIIYNDNVKVIISKKYIDFISKTISDVEGFNSLVLEMIDNDKVYDINISNEVCLLQEFNYLCNNSNKSLHFPICLNERDELKSIQSEILILNEIIPYSKNWIKFELITKSICNVSFRNFSNDNEIELFFKNIFSIPKYCVDYKIFDRNQDTVYYRHLKGQRILYYTFFPRKEDYAYILLAKKILKTELGNNLSFFYSNVKLNLHERKIIFADIVITSDNAHSNITISDPTWEIFIKYDPIHSNSWSQKCIKFKKVK